MREFNPNPVVRHGHHEEQRDPLRKNNLSYFFAQGETNMLGITIGEMVEFAATEYGDTEAFVATFQNIRKTFVQLREDVQNLSKGLIALGLRKGDRMAVWSPNTYECYLTQLAGWNCGLIVVSINAALQGRELLYSLNKVGVRCIMISKAYRAQDFYDILTNGIPEIKLCRPGCLKSVEAPELEFVISVEPNLEGTINFNDLLEIGSSNMLITPKLWDDNIQFDDGTTGSPKAVMLSHHNLVNNGYFVGRRLGLKHKERICLPAPIFHVYGCQIGVFAAMLYGCTTVIPSYGYDQNALVEISSLERCNYITGTPTMFTDVMKTLEGAHFDLTCVKTVITGGSICTQQLVSNIMSKLPNAKVVSNYGMTEIGCAYLGRQEDPDENAYTTVGYLSDNVEAKLVDANGMVVPIGQEGELLIRSYGVFIGYWGEPEKTKEVMEQSRWFHTGDIFTMTESGHGQIVGRIKEMINRGGENVYPKEVEDFLRTHPKIKDAQVFGVPDPRMGEQPAVWIQLHDGNVMTQNDVKSFCKGQIAHFKTPKYIFFRDDFPRTPLGKVQKFKMREETLNILNKL